MMEKVASQQTTPGGASRPTWSCFAVYAVTAIAAALRLAFLGRKSLWLDEILSVSIARLDSAGFRNIVLSWEANMALYYVLLRGWIHLAHGEFGIRLLSALPAIAAVPLLYWVGNRLFDRGTALTAAVLLAVNAFAIRYAQEARSYSLYLLLTVLACGLFLKAIKSQRRAPWCWLAVALVLAAYTHFFACLVLPVLWLGAALHPRRQAIAKPLTITSIAVAIAALPLALFVLLKDKGQLDWVRHTTVRDFYEFLVLLSGRAGPIAVLLALGALVAAAISLLRAARWGAEQRWGNLFAWIWLLLPVGLTWLVSLRKPLFVPRFLLLCLPPFLLLVAAGLRAIRPKWLFGAAFILLLAFSLRGTLEYYRTGFDPPEQNWRGLVGDILRKSRPGDAVIFYHPLARLPFEYYRERFAADSAPQAIFPPGKDARLLKGTPLSPSFLAGLAEQHGRVWLVQNYGPDAFSRQLHRYLAAHYDLRQERVYGVIHVYLYVEPALQAFDLRLKPAGGTFSGE